MKTLRILLATVVVMCISPAGVVAGGFVQAPAVEPEPSQEPVDQTDDAPEAAIDDAGDSEGGEAVQVPGPTRDAVLRIGSDYTVAAGERVREVVLISGSATIEGEVVRDLVVLLGNVNLASTARVGGDLVAVGGDTTIAPGAVVDGDLVVFGDDIVLPPGFAAGGEQVLAETFALGTGVLEFVPYVTRGLFLGRLIVPDLTWVWGIVGTFLVVYLALNLAFDPATRACSSTISDRPFSTLMAGLLALLLAGPVTLLLAVSLVGLAVVPFLWSAFLVAGIVGKVGVLRWIGGSVLGRDTADGRGISALAVVVGFALLTLAYMVPVLGILTWATLGALGLGAAAIAFVGAIRRENPPSQPLPPGPKPTDPNVRRTEARADSAPSETPPGDATGPGSGSSMDMRSVDLAQFPRASFLGRLGAFVLDVFLALMTLGLLGLEGAQFLLLFLAYNIGFWSWKGATVGGIVCQLRVVRMDGKPLEFSDTLVRGLSAIFSLAALGLGCLWVLWDPERQAWHDKVAATYVVRVPSRFAAS